MKIKKIGVIREGKQPTDSRTPLTPDHMAILKKQYPSVTWVVQKSNDRCFSDDEYQSQGIEVVESVDDCDVLFGVKEVPISELISGKVYFFFSHTIKKQSYNRTLLQEILQRNIQLIDYECLKDEKNIRIIAFGRWAGIVGAYNAIWTFGKKYDLFHLKRAHECKDLEELLNELKKSILPPEKIIVTGTGRVALGVLEILNALEIKQVEPAPFFYQTFEKPVFTQVDVNTYYRHKKGHPFHFDHFFKHPEQYISDFLPFTHQADMLINAIYWDPKAPKLFELDDMKDEDFKIRVIADITCDIDGSVPSTIRAATIKDPVYDFDPNTRKELPPFSKDGISVMAIDTLPNELPRESSADFGRQLMENVLPSLLNTDSKGVIGRATITEKGKLTKKFSYLQDYVDGK